MREAVSTDSAPAAIGPYSQAVTTGNLVFASGQLGMCPRTGEIVTGPIADEAQQALRNLDAVLRAAGSSLPQALKVTVYLTDLDQFAAVNDVYATWLSAPYPARACVEVAALPRGARIEIDAVAVRSATS